MKVYFDTAVLVAASVSDHPHHSQAITAMSMFRNKEIVGHVSGHAAPDIVQGPIRQRLAFGSGDPIVERVDRVGI